MADPTWTEVREVLTQRLEQAHAELAQAQTVEAIWRAQGKVQALRELQHVDQTLKLVKG